MSKRKLFFFKKSKPENNEIVNINSSFKNNKKESDEDNSSNFRDGFNIFLDIQKFESKETLKKLDLQKKNTEGSNQDAKKTPPVKKDSKEEEIYNDSILLVGSLSEDPENKLIEYEEENQSANVVLQINIPEDSSSKLVVKPSSISKVKKSSKNFRRDR